MISKENEKELRELGIACAMNFEKLSPAEQRIMLDFFRAMKGIEGAGGKK